MLLGNLTHMGQKHNLSDGTSGTAVESIGLIPFYGNAAKK